ncbi:MAG: RIP metalloprotease RseP [Verrucomicrobiota bacterium]
MILQTLTFIASLLGVAVVFGITVFVHELGHFLAARYKGLHVDRFAIGFGPKICSFKKGGVEYAICWIPFGGYVSLPQMAPMEMVEGESEVEAKDLPPISPWAKIVTAFWGPAFSFLLALACATLLFLVGKNVNTTLETTIIGYVEEDSPAALVGIVPGDKILKIDGKEVTHWSKNGDGGILQAIILSTGETIRLEIEREGRVNTFNLAPVPNPDLEGLRSLGFETPDNRYMPLVVEEFASADSPAAVSGLKVGDQIVAVNGEPVYSMAQISKMVQASTNDLLLGVERNGSLLEMSVSPRLELSTGTMMIGVRWKNDFTEITKISPFTQVNDSVVTMGRTLYALISPQADVGVKHMSGPVGIFNVLRKLLVHDLRDLIAFCVFFNVNLAILNLLPLPILDGGHITFAAIEWITKRPIHVKVLYALQTSFFIILIAFMLFVSFYDVGRIGKDIKQGNENKRIAEEQGETRFEPLPAPAE